MGRVRGNSGGIIMTSLQAEHRWWYWGAGAGLGYQINL